MLQGGSPLSREAIYTFLQVCNKKRDLAGGRQVQSLMIMGDLNRLAALGDHLIRLFAACSGTLLESSLVFCTITQPTSYTWQAIIFAHATMEQYEKALQLYTRMQEEGFVPCGFVLSSTLKACGHLACTHHGRSIHDHLVAYGLEGNLILGSSLVDMYAKCGNLDDALLLFNRSREQDIVSWNVLISRWPAEEVHLLFEKMQEAGIQPDQVTYISVLKSCLSMHDVEKGLQVHCLVVERGFESDLVVGGSLVDMYAKHGKFDYARSVFNRLPEQNVQIWSALISGYVQNGIGLEALILFEEMQKGGVNPNPITFSSILKACSTIGCLDKGRYVYGLYVKCGFVLDLFVGSSLIDMFVKCENLDDARAVFDKLPRKNIVAWSALIGGYAQYGKAQEALQLFKKMQARGIEADEVTFSYALKACSSSAALEQGRGIHALIIERGLESDSFVGSTLVDMYGKLTCLEDAIAVFERIPRRDVVTWSALIGSVGHSGDFSSALNHYRRMEEAGLSPDEVTFLCLLTACSRQGLVKEGNLILNSMMVDYGIMPTCAHYNLLIDLYGNADCFSEAEDLLEIMPFDENVVGWISLLSSCRGRKNLDLGKRCFDQVSAKGHSSAFTLLSNMYIQAGMMENAEKIEHLRRFSNGWKKPGKASIEVDKEVHEFIVGDRVHPESAEILSTLHSLSMDMKVNGYKPRLDLVLGPLSEAKKEDALCGHSEKLAMAFGLIHTPRGATLRVAKNLRMCADCHGFAKSLSNLEMRQIIISDAYRIHQFQDGACSCDDLP
eukprot:c17797_g1_i2 orf=176-2521(+)